MNQRYLAIVLMFLPAQLGAQTLDTLRTFTRGGGYISYADRSLTMQAARFDLAAPAYVHSIGVALGGQSSNGTAVLHLYGYEGGLPAPGLTRDLIPPITLHKSKPGIEHLSIRLRQPVYVASPQLFIAVDELSPGVHLLSDRRARKASCVSGDDVYSAQLLGARATWSWGAYSFLIDAAIEYDRTRSDAGGFADVTYDLGLPDSLVGGRAIAWRDIDTDGYLDLLVAGRLFHNDRGSHFTEITNQAGLAGCSPVAMFLDANNDGNPDIISIEGEGNSRSCVLYRNNGAGGFARSSTVATSGGSVGCMTVADMNGDGALDLFIGSNRYDSARACTLLLNDGHGGFTERADLLGRAPLEIGECRGSQWVDIDGSGRSALSIATDLDIALVHVGTDADAAQGSTMATLPGTGVSTNCHWYDVDNNGTLDFAGPQHLSLAGAHDRDAVSVLIATEGVNGTLQAHGVEGGDYDDQQSAAVWGDIDNDGTPELLTATACDCHYAAIYQQHDGRLLNRARDLGLWRASLGPDAIWVDFDNDGRVDLASFSGGRFRLLRNTVQTSGHWVEVDLDGRHAVGARVEVCAGGVCQTREISSGRGRLMQEPQRLHAGLGSETRVDSVVVRWSDGRVGTYRGLDADRLHRINEQGMSAPVAISGITAITVIPNPARDRVEIGVGVDAPMILSLGVYRLDGTLVRILSAQEHVSDRYSVTWNTDDAQGRHVPQGTYVVRATGVQTERSVKVMIVR